MLFNGCLLAALARSRLRLSQKFIFCMKHVNYASLLSEYIYGNVVFGKC